MRVALRGGWVVGYADGGHRLIPDGVVVIEKDRILEVGSRYDGQADRELDARGKLVCPGFIDTHVHAKIQSAHRLISDAGRQEYFGQPAPHFHVARAGTTIPYESPDLAARYTVTELLRNGTTTFMEIGSPLPLQEHLAREAGRLGVRAYLGPGISCERWVSDERGRIKSTWNEERGRASLAAAIDFIRRMNGSFTDLIRGLLVPGTTDTCSPEIFRAVRRAADELGVPIQTHASASPVEFQSVVLQHGMTPIELLASCKCLGPDVSIGHGNFIAESRFTNYSGGRDLEILAATGTTVAHSPVNLVRRGRFLDHWERYRKAGVNLSLGTDTYPRDMILQMRTASYIGKVLAGSYLAAPASEVFDAATLGGARALGRHDLGRLAPGAKADVIIIAMDALRWGPVRDPIKSLVDCGVCDDVETVIVDGVVRMENGQIPGVDLEALRREAQAAAEEFWARVPEWDPLHRTAEQACPWSYPLAGS